MIINDKHKFVFVHIPKCAGSTIRGQIQCLDETNGFFTKKVEKHEELGLIDYVHLPLFILREYFREEYIKILNYSTYAIIRDPFARFPSSVSQYLKMYGPNPIHKLTKTEIEQQIKNIIQFLRSYNTHFLPAEYIHFQPQVDYIFDQRKRIIKHIYTVDYLNNLLLDIKKQTDIEIGTLYSKNANKSQVYRNKFAKYMIENVRPMIRKFYQPMLNNEIKKRILNKLFVSRNERLEDVFGSEYIFEFIKEYYKEDIILFENINNELKNKE